MKRLLSGWWVFLAFTASACGVHELVGAEAEQEPSSLQVEIDVTPPESVAHVTPGPDASGHYQGPVTVRIEATDDASGVKDISYFLSGATTGDATVEGAVANLPVITHLGTTTITYFATDNVLNTEYSQTLYITITQGPGPIPDPPPAPCAQISLSDYNVFVLGDYSGGGDVQGKVAAGGNIDMQYFSVGAILQASDINDVLVAGGDLNIRYGGVFGNASYGGTTTADRTVTFYRGALGQGTPIDFAAVGVALKKLSANLNARAANGVVRLETWGGLFLEGTHPKLNVFQVDASAFTTTKYLSINAPAQSVVVVNIVGETATLARFSTGFSGGINQTGVLYNFVNATSLNAFGYGFWGTVLAPHAHVNFSEGSFDGAIYAASMSGNAEGHLNPLKAVDLCATEPAPEPSPN
ncbi:MAG: choice-of-anchor A family protein [Myxococcaceae bacterium]|nr:choice-of-anchor A family protein [Myxococcaceae bacterium]